MKDGPDLSKAKGLTIAQMEKSFQEFAKGSNQMAFYSIVSVSWVDPKATYNGCSSCHKKIAEGLVVCPHCPAKPSTNVTSTTTAQAWEIQVNDTILPHYCLRCTFVDDTGGFSQVLFSEQASLLMNNLDVRFRQKVHHCLSN